jgi:hypothetical protein
MRIWLIPILAFVLFGADRGLDLRTAARKGQTNQVDILLKGGAPIDSADKDGKTALMLAAEHGHFAVVRLLLDRGSNATLRDGQGWTAYSLALTAGRDDVLKILSAPPPMEVFLDPSWDRSNLYSSCFMSPAQLADHMSAIGAQTMIAAAVRDFAKANGRGRMEFIATSGGDATLYLRSRPSASCIPQQSVDSLSLEIDVRLERAADRSMLLEKKFGGGLKGLHARTVSSPAQYQPVFSGWAASHASEIYWAAVEAWLRAR